MSNIEPLSNRMVLVALLAVMGICAAAQQPKLSRGESEIEVAGSDWKYAGYSKVEIVSEKRSADGSSGYRVGRGDAYGFKYTATGIFKNNSQKTVKSIEWDFVFSNQDTDKELKRFKIKSKQEIKPGQTVAISKVLFVDTNKDLQALDKAKRNVVVAGVEFAGAQ
jgi:hypothetical protein